MKTIIHLASRFHIWMRSTHRYAFPLAAFFALQQPFAVIAGLEEGIAAFSSGDYALAFREFQPLAEQGNARAQGNLGVMYQNGKGVPKDEKRAFFWYLKAAEQGIARAQADLGFLYANGNGVAQDYQQAVVWYRKAAEQGYAEAQFNLGVMYDVGNGVPKDEQQAIVWYRKAAEQDYARAQFNLGDMYQNGNGVPKDEQQAIVWYRRAAEKGNASAQFNLGLIYEFGNGVPKDKQQALVWYRKAAEQGNAGAQLNMGFKYQNGNGVPKDEQQAVVWYRRAAEQDYAPAQHNLGVMYRFGNGVPKDHQHALVWFRKAAEQGHAPAQAGLAGSYMFGAGAPKDEQQAYFWLLLASAQGHKAAKESMEFLEPQLTAAQRAAAQAAARNWRPVIASAGGSVPAAPNPFSQPPNQTLPRPAGLASTGTGFTVTSNRVVTNAHVVEGCGRLELAGNGPARVIATDRRNDLALIGAANLSSAVTLRAGRLRQGDEIAVVGFPLAGLLASGAQITTGNVSALAGMQNDSRFIQISAPVQPGNSGGPLLDTSGNVVGVVVSKLNAQKIADATGDIPQNVNFAISPLILQGFLEANGVNYQTASSTRKLSTADVAEAAKRFTYMVECWK
jgi:uncharacterized protein